LRPPLATLLATSSRHTTICWVGGGYSCSSGEPRSVNLGSPSFVGEPGIHLHFGSPLLHD
jgi:hypothetical protein